MENFFVDAHTHLNSEKLFDSWIEKLDSFISLWWKKLINVWADDFYNEKTLLISHKVWKNILYKNVSILSSIWYHPYEVVVWHINEKNIHKKMSDLFFLYEKNKDIVVAIWECWLDYHYDWNINKELQKKMFFLQCEVAEKVWLPLIIHSRDSFDDTFDIVKKFKNLKIYFHCWWYGVEEIEFLKKQFSDFFVGFTWNITYKKSFLIRDSLSSLWLDNVLLETDAPYLSPQNLRWKVNEPKNIEYIYNFVADYLNIDIDFLKKTIYKNFNRFYNL